MPNEQSMTKIKITKLPDRGQLMLNSFPLTSDGRVLNVSDFDNGQLVFAPAPNESGMPYTTIEFRSFDGAEYSESTYRMIVYVWPVPDSPAVAPLTGELTYTRGTGPRPLVGAIQVTHPDHQDIHQAIITVQRDEADRDDVLSSTTSQSGITSAWDASTGRLTLTGQASASAYQEALRSVTYENVGSAVSQVPRVVQIVVTDTLGYASEPSTRHVTVLAAPEPPVVAPLTGELTYTRETGPRPLVGAIQVTHPEQIDLQRATITIQRNNDDREDILTLTADQAKIADTWDAATGTLTLTGQASTSEYQAVLRSVVYENVGISASQLPRIVRFVVTDTSDHASEPATRQVTVLPADQPPTSQPIEQEMIEGEQLSFDPQWFLDAYEDAGGQPLAKIVLAGVPSATEGRLIHQDQAVVIGQEIGVDEIDQLVFEHFASRIAVENGQGSIELNISFKVSNGKKFSESDAELRIRVNALVVIDDFNGYTPGKSIAIAIETLAGARQKLLSQQKLETSPLPWLFLGRAIETLDEQAFIATRNTQGGMSGTVTLDWFRGLSRSARYFAAVRLIVPQYILHHHLEETKFFRGPIVDSRQILVSATMHSTEPDTKTLVKLAFGFLSENRSPRNDTIYVDPHNDEHPNTPDDPNQIIKLTGEPQNFVFSINRARRVSTEREFKTTINNIGFDFAQDFEKSQSAPEKYPEKVVIDNFQFLSL